MGAGECSRLLLHQKEEDMVIAVDGGYEYVKDGQVDLVVGDFDSLGFVPEHPHVIALAPEKDDTDMLFAIKEGLKAGYEVFHIYGGMGGRISHTIANIQCLSYLAERGAKGYLLGGEEVVALIKEDTLCFSDSYKGYISVFSYGERAEGVTLKGLKYPLEDAVLTQQFPIGVSNEFTGVSSLVSVKKGTLLIIFQRQE